MGYDLFSRLSRDWLLTMRTITFRNTSIQDAEKVIYFRNRAYRTPRVTTGRFLRDGNGGTKSRDMIDVRFWHLPEKLAGETGKALNIPPLSFRKQSVEC